MLSVVINRDVGRPRVLRGFIGDDASAVAILLQGIRIGRFQQQAQPASLRHAAGKPVERLELIAIDLSGLDQLLLPERVAVSRPHEVLGEQNARSVRNDLEE